MSGDEPRSELFRPAAVAAHRGGSAPREPLESSHRLTSWAYRGLLALVVAALIALFTVTVEETSSGVWVAGPQPGTATVVLPIGAIDRLRPGQRVGLRANGRPALIDATLRQVLAPLPVGAALARFGSLPRSLRVGSAVAVVEVDVTGSLPERGTATAHLARHPLIAELVPALRDDGPKRG